MNKDVIVNRVANSGLLNIDLSNYRPKLEILELDLKLFLFNGVILKEALFRDHLKKFDFADNNLIITTEIEGQNLKLKTSIFEKKIDPNFIFEKEVIVKNGNSLWRIARKTLSYHAKTNTR